MNELINEYATMLLGIFHLSFLNTAYGPQARYMYGWFYICIWMGLLVSNIFFIVYCSFIQNYHLTMGFLVKRKEE
jgi:hypothetical protein